LASIQKHVFFLSVLFFSSFSLMCYLSQHEIPAQLFVSVPGAMFSSINPATGRLVREFPRMAKAEIPAVLSRAEAAAAQMRSLTLEGRAAHMRTLAGILRERARAYGETITLEMGKPIKQAVAEVEKCAFACDWFAENAAPHLQDQLVATDASKSYVTFRPMGVIFGVFPWNFPFWQVARFAASAMMAGNVCIMKHAPSVPQCALALEQAFADAGFPQHTLQNVFADVEEDVPALVADPRVRAVTLTGSCRAGSAIAQFAGKHMKKCVLELGGADPYLVLHDADVDLAVSQCVAGRMLNAGQSCIAAKRWIVDQSLVEEFTTKAAAALAKMKMGDPMDPTVDVGPMARRDLRDALHDQVVRSVKAGAKVVLGGSVPDVAGFYYPPTLLTNVVPGSAAFEEEMFGPVASIIVARDEADAIRLANQSPFGLGAAVFTRDTARGEKIARDLDCGMAFVNGFVKSDPRLPFGGVKQSGIGVECSHLALHEFTVSKTIWIK
jgi:succinate-semialdehyde dehydrogenase/glutarate-semialdehyde dehydrogenase